MTMPVREPMSTVSQKRRDAMGAFTLDTARLERPIGSAPEPNWIFGK